jgi:hypothetical protein
VLISFTFFFPTRCSQANTKLDEAFEKIDQINRERDDWMSEKKEISTLIRSGIERLTRLTRADEPLLASTSGSTSATPRTTTPPPTTLGKVPTTKRTLPRNNNLYEKKTKK